MQHTLSIPFDHWFASLTPVQKPPHEAAVNELLSRFGVKKRYGCCEIYAISRGEIDPSLLKSSDSARAEEQDLAMFLQNLELQKNNT